MKDFVILNDQPFFFKQLLHPVGTAKMMLAGEQALAIHDAVSRQMRDLMGSAHRIAHHSGPALQPDALCNSAITGYLAPRDKPDNLIHQIKNI